MAMVISVALQKGGVGKSTTSLALASTLGFKKKKVLLIDMDSQANTTYSSGVEPPALGNLSYNSLVASNYVIIPTEPRPFALQGLSALNRTIQNVQNRHNSTLKVLGILLIKYSNRTVLNRDIKDMIAEYAEQMHTTLFDTTIREGVAVAEAQTTREPLIDYAKNSKPNIDYKAFTTELLKRIGA